MVASGSRGFMQMIVALILLCTAYSMNFCMLIFYMIMVLNDGVQFLSIVGLEIQRGTFIYRYQKDSKLYDPYRMSLFVAFLVFAIVAITISFLAYREFKGVALD
jgi:hypothetical protein